MGAWGDSWGVSWGDSWGSVGALPRQGGLHGLRAQFRKTESEEQKRLRREAQGIIKRIQQAEPEESQQVKAEAVDISAKLRATIVNLEAQVRQYQTELFTKKALAQMQEIQSLLIDAQLRAEQAQQQIEELDVVYVAFMLAVLD